jgi:hypothetical protein
MIGIIFAGNTSPAKTSHERGIKVRKDQTMATRRAIVSGISLASMSLLTSCGTIIYPDRVNQKNRGKLDPSIIILDGIGLFFFLVPGVIAFAVDLATGAIFFPEGQGHGDEERTIFDDLSMIRPAGGLNQQVIEHFASERAGAEIDLNRDDVQVVQLDDLCQFRLVYDQFANNPLRV